MTIQAPVRSAKHETALDYAAQGIPIFPCLPNDKAPACPNGFKDASTDKEQIEKWWSENPDYNVATCPEASGWAVIDPDKKNGGLENWQALCAQHGGEVRTTTVRTPHGGRHLYYAGSIRTTTGSTKPGTLPRGVDTRGIGGYVLLPPSIIDGKEYQWTDECPISPLPEWIPPLLAKPDVPVAAAKGEPVSLEHLKKLLSYIRGAEMSRDLWRNIVAAIRNTNVPDDDDDSQRLNLAIEWSRGDLTDDIPPGNYDGDEAVEELFWSMPPRADGVGYGTILHAAREGGYVGSSAAPAETPEQVFGAALDKLNPELSSEGSAAHGTGGEYPPPLSAHELAHGDFRRPTYIIAGLLLRRFVNLLYGNGGVGKTLLALLMAVAVAANRQFLGLETVPAHVLLVLAEDSYGETKYRLERICAFFGVKLEDLPITIWCLPGHDVTMATIADNGQIVPAPFHNALETWLRAHPGALVVLDSLADIAALNESLRLPVNALFKRLLGGMCEAFDATILVLAHPSKASMEDGSLYSGSTAHNNAVRSRLTLEQPTKGSNRRVLKVAKSNYGAEREIELFLMHPVFMSAGEAGQASQADAEREAVMGVVFKMLDSGIAIVRSNGAGQKPSDVAAEVFKLHGIRLDAHRVKAILNDAERAGVLEYRNGGNSRREQKAGFVRKEQPL